MTTTTFSQILTVLGLATFETISSVDNAVVNAEVLSTMGTRARKFFTTWGLVPAVFVARCALPALIVWFATPRVSLLEAAGATATGNAAASAAVEAAAPALLTAGGTFLALLFAHWLLAEDKEFGLPHEKFVSKIGKVWFYAAAAVCLLVLMTVARHQPQATTLMLAAAAGSTAYFVVGGLREHAEDAEARARDGKSAVSDVSKILLLEAIDLAFSVDGVVGAFAFTTSVPLILVGSGLGAGVVRQLTLGGVGWVQRHPLLKNGAMYSVGALALVMLAEGLGAHVPKWVSPAVTFLSVGSHLWLSVRRARVARLASESLVDGLPPIALRHVQAEWEHDSGLGVLQVEVFGDVGTENEYVYAEGRPESLYLRQVHKFGKYKPHGKTWLEVRVAAAARLGKDDAAASKTRRPSEWSAFAQDLGVDWIPGTPESLAVAVAYRDAYEAETDRKFGHEVVS